MVYLSKVIEDFEKAMLNDQLYKYNLKEVINSILAEATPKSKTVVNYDLESDLDSLVFQLREAIITNLYLNSTFVAKLVLKENYLPFFNLLKCKIDQLTKTKLLLALHFSKSDIDKADDFFNFFNNFWLLKEIVLKETIDYKILNDLANNDFYKALINNKLIVGSIKKALELMNINVDLESIQISLRSLGLKWIIFKDENLVGFFGIECIYVNADSILNFFESGSKFRGMEEAALLIKLELTRLICHEAAHVLLRKLTRDFNISTPDLVKPEAKLPENTGKVPEIGVISEHFLFGGNIDFRSTASEENQNYDFSHILNMMRNVENEVPLQIDQTTLVMYGCDEITTMAVDMRKAKKIEESLKILDIFISFFILCLSWHQALISS